MTALTPVRTATPAIESPMPFRSDAVSVFLDGPALLADEVALVERCGHRKCRPQQRSDQQKRIFDLSADFTWQAQHDSLRDPRDQAFEDGHEARRGKDDVNHKTNEYDTNHHFHDSFEQPIDLAGREKENDD